MWGKENVLNPPSPFLGVENKEWGVAQWVRFPAQHPRNRVIQGGWTNPQEAQNLWMISPMEKALRKPRKEIEGESRIAYFKGCLVHVDSLLDCPGHNAICDTSIHSWISHPLQLPSADMHKEWIIIFWGSFLGVPVWIPLYSLLW